MGIIFGTDGWRGLLAEDMNEHNVELVAQAFADYLNSDAAAHTTKVRVAVGYDGRTKSSDFARLFALVLSGNNIETFVSETVIPTPVLSYYVKANSLSAGVMITASHNPPEYNGIKFKASYGGPFLTEETIKVEHLLNSNPVRKSQVFVITVDMLPVYIKQLDTYIDFKLISESGLTVLADSMSGAGRTILETILEERNCKADTIFGMPRTDFSGRLAEPIEKNLGPLLETLSGNNDYALGIATDGDADRLGVAMDGGVYLSAQETILYLADYITRIKKLPGNLVKTSSVTDKLRSCLGIDGRIVHDVQVGFKYICEKMISDTVAMGAEESGGYGFYGHIPERDGILSGLLFLEMLAASGLDKLSRYVEIKRKEFGLIHYDRIDFKYEGSDRTEKLPDLTYNPPESICGFKVENLSAFLSSRGIVNGLKFDLEGGERWLLLRASETEPMVRIYSEGRSDDEVKNFLSAGMGFISKQ